MVGRARVHARAAELSAQSRCLYCAGLIPEDRYRLRGRRSLYCSDDHHERDKRHEANAQSGQARFPGVRRRLR